MTDYNKPFVPKSVDQMQNEYMERPFMLRNFYIGSQFTIAEDHLRTIPLRYKIETSQKTGKPYGTYLIKINDGYITKDLALFPDEVIALFRTLPKTVTQLKGVTINNENGKWVFLSQTTEEDNSNFPKSSQLAATMEPSKVTPSALSEYGRQLSQAVVFNSKMGIPTDIKALTKMAEIILPNRALDLITAAREGGWIYEKDGIFRGE